MALFWMNTIIKREISIKIPTIMYINAFCWSSTIPFKMKRIE